MLSHHSMPLSTSVLDGRWFLSQFAEVLHSDMNSGCWMFKILFTPKLEALIPHPTFPGPIRNRSRTSSAQLKPSVCLAYANAFAPYLCRTCVIHNVLYQFVMAFQDVFHELDDIPFGYNFPPYRVSSFLIACLING